MQNCTVFGDIDFFTTEHGMRLWQHTRIFGQAHQCLHHLGIHALVGCVQSQSGRIELQALMTLCIVEQLAQMRWLGF